MTTTVVNFARDCVKFGHLAEICYIRTDGHSKTQTHRHRQYGGTIGLYLFN